MKKRLQRVIWWLDDLTDWASRIGEVFSIGLVVAMFAFGFLVMRMLAP